MTDDAGRVDSALRAGGNAGGASSVLCGGGPVPGQRQEATPDIIGRAFVKEYYTRLNSEPSSLVNFYGDECQVLHFDADDEAPRPVSGRDAVRKRIEAHRFRNCLAVISYIDAVAVSDVRGVLILVMGKLSNDGREYRRFVQNFLLVSRDSPSGMKYHVCVNDVFRFLDPEEPVVEQRTLPDAETQVVQPSAAERTPASRETHLKSVETSAARVATAGEERHRVDDHGERPPRQDAAKVVKHESGEDSSAAAQASKSRMGARRRNRMERAKNGSQASPSDGMAARSVDHTWTKSVGTKADDATRQQGEVPVVSDDSASAGAPRVDDAAGVGGRAFPASGASPSAGVVATPPAASASGTMSAADTDSSASAAASAPAGGKSVQQFHPVGGSAQAASIYVSRLPRNATQSQLEDEFSRFGRIKRVVFKEKDHPYAFVDFEDNESMRKALSVPVRLDGQQLLVEEKTNQTRRSRGVRGRGGSDRSFQSPGRGFGGSPRTVSPRGSDRPRSRGGAGTERRGGYRDSAGTQSPT